ncbi:MAG TPA: endonuclease VII domain-containing protein [Rhabdochlamydiaceae bacterium]|jgi:hypothetical protein
MNKIVICTKHDVEKRKVGKSEKFRCHICHNEKSKRRYFEKNKDKILAKINLSTEEKKERFKQRDRDYKKKIYYENKEPFIQRAKKWYEKNKEKRRKTRLLKDYGITLEEYTLMCKEQNNKCLICNKEEIVLSNKTKNIKRLSVDHCHATKKVRGLLCSKCNCVIGYAGESIEILENAIEYLKGNKP